MGRVVALPDVIPSTGASSRAGSTHPAGSSSAGPAWVMDLVAGFAETTVTVARGRARGRARDLAGELARRATVRDLTTLREHHGGVDGEALADALVEASARATGAVGLLGGVSALRTIVRRSPLAGAVNLAAEGLAVAAIEIKLVAELHEVYGVAVPGDDTQRAGVFARTWAAHRLGDLGRVRSTGGVGGQALMLARLAARGAADDRATRALADRVRTDLRRRAGQNVSH